MKKLILAIFCLSIIGFTYSQSNNADGEYLKIVKEYTLNEDGSIDYHYYKEIKLHSHYAFHRLYGETFIVYNTDYQKLSINSAYTIMADGKKVVTPENAFNRVLPRFSTDAPAYNNIREMVVTHTGLEVGCTIYLDYTIHTQKGFYPSLMADELLEESSPINHLEIIVNVPKGHDFSYKLFNISAEALVSTANNMDVYSMSFKNIPANSKDNYQEDPNLSSPRIIFSTSKDLNKVVSDFTNQKAFDYEGKANMDMWLEDFQCNNPDKLEVALEVQKHLVDNMKTQNIPMEYTGFSCRTADETWDSNKGTPIEKAVLMKTILDKAFIKSDIVAVVPSLFFDKEMGNILNYDEFLILVDIDGDKFYLSPIRKSKNIEDYQLRNCTLVLLDKNAESIKTLTHKTSTNEILLNANINILDKDSLTADIQLKLKGLVNPYFKLQSKKDKIKSNFSGLPSKSISDVDVKTISMEVAELKLRSELSNPFTIQENYFKYQLPKINGGVDSWHYNLLTAKRNSVLKIPFTINEKYEFKIKIPEGFKYVSGPQTIEISNSIGHLLMNIDVNESEIVIEKWIKIDKNTVKTTEYQDFKVIMDVWNNHNNNFVIFKD